MPKPNEVATITANGEEFKLWETVDITRRIGDTVTHMYLTVAELGLPPSKLGFQSLRLKPGDVATGSLAGRLVMTGCVTVRQVAYTAQSHSIQITVSSKTLDALDSSGQVNPGQWTNQTMQQIGSDLLSPYSIGFSLSNVPDRPFERFSIHPGETVIACIERMCRFRDAHLVDDTFGNLVALRAGGGGSVAELVEGRNIESLQGVMSIAETLSQIDVKGQQFGSDQHWGTDASEVAATATNANAGRYRYGYITAEQNITQQDAKDRANHEMAYVLGDNITIFVTVPGWLADDGQLWIEKVIPSQFVTLYSPMMLPVDSMTLSIRGVSHRQSRDSGTTSVIELCLPNALSSGGQIEVSGVPGGDGGAASAGP